MTGNILGRATMRLAITCLATLAPQVHAEAFLTADVPVYVGWPGLEGEGFPKVQKPKSIPSLMKAALIHGRSM